jgi:hypothetical protein
MTLTHVCKVASTLRQHGLHGHGASAGHRRVPGEDLDRARDQCIGCHLGFDADLFRDRRGRRARRLQRDARALRLGGERFPALDLLSQLRACRIPLPHCLPGFVLPITRVGLGLLEAVRILVGRVAAQRLEPLSRGGERLPRRVVGGDGGVLRRACLVERGLRAVARLARTVERRLRLTQLARLSSRDHAGVHPVAALELRHRLQQPAGLVELPAIFLELVERLRHVAEQLVGQRRQGLGKRIGQRGLVGLLRQLRLSQLDQGVDEGVVATRAELEQPLVHCAPVTLRRGIQLAATGEGLTQALPGQYVPLVRREPDVLADARVRRGAVALDQEEPAVHVRPARHGGESDPEREVTQASVRLAAAELEPAVTDATRITAHQQVPGHLLARVAVGLDTRWTQLRVEQQRQRQ